MDLIREKIKSPQQLATLLKKKRGKKKVVFTNGCFDILHLGHVTYLEKARKQGDLLVVALDTDESVRAVKGPTRPMNPLEDRMGVIAALGSVDFVTFFEGGDPRPLITQLKPNVLVKGGDWKPEQILGSEEVKGWGGTVKSLPFVEGRSTTALIKKVTERCE
jgi:rfaE bifunctional protein nucleotidyltransferase chain/domain